VSNLNPQQFSGPPLRWTRSAMTVSWHPPEGAPDRDYENPEKEGYGDYCMDCGFPELEKREKAGLETHVAYHDNFDHACEGPNCGIDPVKAEREWMNDRDEW
jgi:hypothetical protein